MRPQPSRPESERDTRDLSAVRQSFLVNLGTGPERVLATAGTGVACLARVCGPEAWRGREVRAVSGRWPFRGRCECPSRVFSLYVVQAGGCPRGGGRACPAAFNRAVRSPGDWGRAARVSHGVIPDAGTGSLSPSSGRKVSGPVAGAGWKRWSAASAGPGSCRRSRRRRRGPLVSWTTRQRSSAAARRRTRPGPWPTRAGGAAAVVAAEIPHRPARCSLRGVIGGAGHRLVLGGHHGDVPEHRPHARRRSAAGRARSGGRCAPRRKKRRRRCRTGTAGC